MSVSFLDHQDPLNPLNGRRFQSGADLATVLADLRARPPFFCEIIGDKGFKQLLGVGPGQCCVQHSASSGEPPYLMAVGDSKAPLDEYVEFLSGNTLTPVARRYCVSFDLMTEVVVHFVAHGDRLPTLEWEEI